ncbi:zinc knuckle [Ancylostoma ceylanicum]|uniref:Zinc knuckle n=1 Tax=Ancylostoma ceylanicum TaxID=53326 RepID=A0A0D6LD11_9BILA|nr:zinc knuckle [Ancylostoma ceylanicum]
MGKLSSYLGEQIFLPEPNNKKQKTILSIRRAIDRRKPVAAKTPGGMAAKTPGGGASPMSPQGAPQGTPQGTANRTPGNKLATSEDLGNKQTELENSYGARYCGSYSNESCDLRRISEGLDDIVILGTNALEVFGIQLGKVEPMESAEAERPVRDEEPECEMETTARELTEEELLASPGDEQQTLENAMETESQTDARIGIECESVLSRKFRSNDPVRNEVSDTVRNQAMLACESVKNIFEQIVMEKQKVSTERGNEVETGVFEILKIAHLTNTEKLEKCLDEKVRMMEERKTMCQHLHCRPEELGQNVVDMVQVLRERSNEIEVLQSQIEQYKLQVADLTKRVQHLGQPIESPASAVHEPDLSRLDDWDPHMLLAVAQQKLCKAKGGNVTYVGHRRVWDDKSRIQLFEGLLRRNALTVFETLPEAVKNDSFDAVVSAMKERLMEDSNNARVKAMSALRKLTIREGQSVGEFCLLLERLAAKAYPDVPPEATSLQKAEILFNQLANWEGSYNLSEALEVNDKGQAYEKVKEAALRLERTKKTAKEMAVGYKNERTQHYRQHTTIWRKWSPVQKRRDKDESDEPRNKNIEMSKGTSTGSEEIKCFRCGKMGHMAKKCKTVLEPQQRTAGAPSRQPPIGPPNHGSFSAMLDRLLCTTTKTAPERHSYLFGSKTITPIILMGLEVTALLDTGSETSIVPLSVFRTARNMRIDIDSHVKRIPQEDAVIRNASGQRMSFVDTIQMDVTLYGETKSVAFHVGEGLDDIVILGTNALEVFGIQLGKVEPMESAEAERPVRDEEPECEVEEARVLRRIFLPPGGTTFIPLGATLRRGEAIFVSHNPALAHGICRISAEGTAEIPIVNVGTQPVVFRKGEVVGVWQEGDYVPRGALEEQANMMEKQPNEELNSQERTQTLFELMVLGAMRKANLRLKPQKCHFLNEKVEFLGHVIQANGVSTDPDKIRKMTDYPTPKNKIHSAICKDSQVSLRVNKYKGRVEMDGGP